MKGFKKKLLISLVACLLLSLTAVGAFATEDTPPITLFDMNGDYVKYNPFGGGESTESWHLIGADSILNGDDRTYPISFKNGTYRDSYYYVAGSNGIENSTLFENLTSFYENDFAIEYELKYNADSTGYVSVAIAYNYESYIDAYISCDGTGDIRIVSPEGTSSVLDSGSILSISDSSNLIRAIYGNGKSVKLMDTIMVSLRVTVNENKVPKKIDMYLNGCLVAETDGSFEDKVEALTPEYTLGDSKEFPYGKLGHIIALKATAGVDCSVNSLALYSVKSENASTNDGGAKHYADTYGNASYKPKDEEPDSITGEESTSIGENTSDGVTGDSFAEDTVIENETFEVESGDDVNETSTEEETTKKNKTHKDDEIEYFLDVIPTLCLIFGISGGAIIVIAIVILKSRTRKK